MSTVLMIEESIHSLHSTASLAEVQYFDPCNSIVTAMTL